MARNKPPRRRYQPRPVDLDTFGLAATLASKLTQTQRAPLEDAITRSFQAMRTGAGSQADWANLADCLNVAEALADLGIASDHTDTFVRGQTALAAVHARVAAGRSWTLYPPEITALDDACFVARIQLEHASQGEYRNAIHSVQRRVAGALSGSPPQGALVCIAGSLGTTHQQAPRVVTAATEARL
jgi:hypothetical protein